MLLSELKNKSILILGFGREGKDTFLFLRKKFLEQRFGVADEQYRVSHGRKKRVIWHLGKNYLRAIPKYDVLVRSPGIPLWKIKPYMRNGQRATSQTALFFANCPGTIIGVTGTKGKSTTSSLIYGVLKEAGRRAFLVGNIETPSLSLLQKAKQGDVFVYELSSFQLADLEQSPHIAIILNVFPEHLDRHGTLKEYLKAKSNIARFQKKGDIVIYDAQNRNAASLARLSKGRKIPFTRKKRIEKSRSGIAWVAATEPAVIVGKLLGISKTGVAAAIRKFKPLAHRMEPVGTFRGITFVNDSAATNPAATYAALKKLHPHTLIAGGLDRGLSYRELAHEIEKSSVRLLILFPDTGKKILRDVRKNISHCIASDMKEAVRLSYAHTPKGNICLLSPASASFNMFRDFKDRGDQFKRYVMKYAKKKK
ncbi:MAG: UDP-N-acetylmuramoyl-L-alanine--D-glutamate ligase [Parcubacteria group bacterium]|nr:UDP-N-acetylmuramoyl-L-alanine--D-glutamate ligase [Parcubacteria group bacterium]